jgi:hypothetical protein
MMNSLARLVPILAAFAGLAPGSAAAPLTVECSLSLVRMDGVRELSAHYAQPAKKTFAINGAEYLLVETGETGVFETADDRRLVFVNEHRLSGQEVARHVEYIDRTSGAYYYLSSYQALTWFLGTQFDYVVEYTGSCHKISDAAAPAVKF